MEGIPPAERKEGETPGPRRAASSPQSKSVSLDRTLTGGGSWEDSSDWREATPTINQPTPTQPEEEEEGGGGGRGPGFDLEQLPTTYTNKRAKFREQRLEERAHH